VKDADNRFHAHYISARSSCNRRDIAITYVSRSTSSAFPRAAPTRNRRAAVYREVRARHWRATRATSLFGNDREIAIRRAASNGSSWRAVIDRLFRFAFSSRSSYRFRRSRDTAPLSRRSFSFSPRFFASFPPSSSFFPLNADALLQPLAFSRNRGDRCAGGTSGRVFLLLAPSFRGFRGFRVIRNGEQRRPRKFQNSAALRGFAGQRVASFPKRAESNLRTRTRSRKVISRITRIRTSRRPQRETAVSISELLKSQK